MPFLACLNFANASFFAIFKNPLNCPAKENSLNQKIFENLKEWRKTYEKTINGNKNKV